MNWDIMGAWFLFNVMVCVAAVSFAIFLNTKAGKKWKKNLYNYGTDLAQVV